VFLEAGAEERSGCSSLWDSKKAAPISCTRKLRGKADERGLDLQKFWGRRLGGAGKISWSDAVCAAPCGPDSQRRFAVHEILI
jgi:hypothetical protein